MMKDLNWHPLDQRRIDSRLLMLYKVTYDLVAIPASQYLIRNARLSRHIHPLSYRQIPILKDYYRFIAGRPKAALLFWFFGDFRCGALLFMVIHVIYKYKNK